MSTEVTPETLHIHAQWLRDHEGWATEADRMDEGADRLDGQQRRPLPTRTGLYPGIVVERDGKTITGAMLNVNGIWITAEFIGDWSTHAPSDPGVTIRWAEQYSTTPGQTPGQTLWETEDTFGCMPWGEARQPARDRAERIANAVLAVHGTPTLTPVGEYPKPGTRGLLPVRFVGEWGWRDVDTGREVRLLGPYPNAILADPRPDGAA